MLENEIKTIKFLVQNLVKEAIGEGLKEVEKKIADLKKLIEKPDPVTPVAEKTVSRFGKKKEEKEDV